MRLWRAFACLLLLGWASPALAAAVHKDGCVATAAVACTLSGTAAAGDFWVGGVITTAGTTVSSFTDDKSDSCSLGTAVTHTTVLTPVYCPNLTSGASIFTATLSGASVINRIAGDTFSGVVTATPLDKATGQYQATPGTGSNAITSGSTATTGISGELVWGMSANILGTAGSGTITAGTGFTTEQTTANVLRTEFLLQGAPAAAAATFTASNAGDSFNTVVLTFMTGELSSKIVGFTVLNGVDERASKIVGFTVLNGVDERASKVVGFVVLNGSQEAMSKNVGFAVLCTPPGTLACPIPPSTGGGVMMNGIGN